ncbi:MAG TPA: SDR family NAD(P)-dependent oxidoreductase, partial [Mycobacterium sp.]|nr:SDR family NAD(P)-dependent oxidoreductase [Mycobacterium sp.]
MTFASKYGPWAVVAGASDGVGAAFAEGLAQRGVNVVLVARRLPLLDEVAAGIADRTGVQTRTLAIDLAEHDAASQVASATADIEVGFLVYCAGADPNFEPFLANSIETAEAMVHRNCIVPMQLCHHFAPAMVDRGRGGIVIFGSGAGLAGGPNMVAYGATKAFDMVFAEALWSELHDKGIDVLGLILGKTNTPALRRLEHSRGVLGSEDEAPSDAASVDEIISEAFENLANGPTVMAGD